MSQLLERCLILKEMMNSQSALSQSGEYIPMTSGIPLSFAEALYEKILELAPAICLEVGMACGISSLAILTALRDVGGDGRLISIDPSQSTVWKGCGSTAIARSGLGTRHELIEDYDYNALPRLLAEGLKIDFAYLDGWHTFDYTLLDWFYAEKMLKVDGIIAFNDCGWPSVDKAIDFVLTHRKYTEIDVGLPVTIVNGKQRFEDRYFKKIENWEPRWDFFAQF